MRSELRTQVVDFCMEMASAPIRLVTILAASVELREVSPTEKEIMLKIGKVHRMNVVELFKIVIAGII